jgi:hypothetical protein
VEERQPFYKRVGFWTGPFLVVVALLVAVLLAVGWNSLGGFPRDFDKYATIPVPGAQTVNLPEGDVRLNFENDAFRSGDSSHLEDQPEGLDVRVISATTGDEAEVEDVPSWIFSSVSDDRGHEPWGKVEIPEAGDYTIQATDDASGGFGSKPPPAQADDAGPEIAVGQSPWTPGGSVMLGAILCGVAVFTVILLLFGLPFWIAFRKR